MISTSRFKSALPANVPGLRAFAMCLVQAPEEADDLVQRVLAEIWAERSRCEPEAVRFHLFRLIHRAFLSRECDRTHSAWTLSRMSTRASFAALLHSLPAEERGAISLVVACDLSYREAAGICDCDAATLTRRVERVQAFICRTGFSAPMLEKLRPW